MSLLLGESAMSQVLRVAAIYLFTLAMLRLAGKRRLARLSAFDILIIIALGSAVGDVMVYPEKVVQIGDAALAIFTVVALQIALSKLMEKNKLLAHIIEGRGTALILNGKIIRKNLDREDLTPDDLDELLREKGVLTASEVKEAVLEPSGELSVIRKR
ncbi:MAG: YetF domain-containing protein [Candidatus Micrarchaeota archaeon]